MTQNPWQNNYAAWIKKAEEDEISIVAILKEGGAPSTACFLSQQMAEKMLKALLIFHNREFPKIHDLLELETILLALEPNIQKIHQDIQLLNRYYIETRYPGDYPEFSMEECAQAREAALNVKKFVLEQIDK